MRRWSGGGEAGVALVLTLFATAALSMLGASVLLVSRMETFASMNHRMTANARYGAEAGIHQAANYLLHTYVAPGTAADPLSNYTMTVSPVRRAGAAVILSSNPLVPANYPVAATQTAFAAAMAAPLTSGTWRVGYTVYATLLSMRQVGVFGATVPTTLQTWQITSEGTIAGPRPVLVQVSAILERHVAPTFPYVVFAESPMCSALSFLSGGTASYDSKNIVRSGGELVPQYSSGDVGTNGNLTQSSSDSTYLFGSLSTPMTGTGSCSSGNVKAWTYSITRSLLNEGLVPGVEAVTLALPVLPSPLPPITTLTISSNSCSGSGISGCTSGSPSGIVLPPGSYGNITIASGVRVHFRTGVYAINSIAVSSSGSVLIDSGPVIWKVVGTGKTTPIDLNGTLTNVSLDPSLLQIEHGGGGAIRLRGGTAASALVHAPGSTVTMSDVGAWYGAINAEKFVNPETDDDDEIGPGLYYDRQLVHAPVTLGQSLLSAFTWNKY